MTTPTSPAAVRLRRPGWRDPRLLLGLVLVALSVALGVVAVGAAGHTVAVLAAPESLVPGTAIDPDRLVVREVSLAEAEGAYLRRDSDLLGADLVVVRTVGAGELIPVEAVAPARALEVRPLAVVPDGALSVDVVPGAVVDLWFVPEPATGQDLATGQDPAEPAQDPAEPDPATPYQLATGLTVSQVTDQGGALSVGGAVSVHVLVPIDQLPQVLGALAADGSVEVVPVAGTVPEP